MRAEESRSFGEVLKHHRLAAGLSQEELAGRARLSPRGVSDLERGARTSPRPATVRLLANALGLTESERTAFLATALGGATMEAPAEATPDSRPGASSSPTEPATSGLPSGTVTFLFTDIEGSTRLLHQLGPRYADALARQQRILRAAFAAHGGHEVDTQGDSFFAAFPTARDGIACAIEAQRALAAEPWPEGAHVQVRMGLHSGAPQLVGSRYVGLDVHRAARIAAAGHGEQVLLSAATAELVRHELPEDTNLRDLGVHRLKDLQQPERVYQVVVPDLPSEFPPLKALDARVHNLPVQPTTLLGREHEVMALCTLLRREDVRLVTLTGPAGVGKTRLSVQVAAEVLDAFPDGVWNVRLSRLTDPALVVPTIATTLELKESGATPLAEVLKGYLRDKRLLLVLDNFEQVVSAAAQIGELLAACSTLTVLVTTRVPLHLRGEYEYALKPLALPDATHVSPSERLSQYAAVALFIERAQAAQADFQITNANAPAVAEICAQLDGLPLAIELAAARVKLLPPPALLIRLQRSLSMLTGGTRDLDERQQTMRNTLAWSYDLLAPEVQRLFRRLAVFVGGCTLEAAEAVCVAPEGAEPLGLDLLEGLSALVDQSLVQQRASDAVGGEPRFSMLHVIREFALERHEGSGEAEALHQAHASYFLQLGARAETELRGEQQSLWLRRLDIEHDNLRAALSWLRDSGRADQALSLAVALARYWYRRGHFTEGRRWLVGLLAQTASHHDEVTGGRHLDGDVRGRALLSAFDICWMQQDLDQAASLGEQFLAFARTTGEVHQITRALIALGLTALAKGTMEQGAAYLQESLSLARQAGDRTRMTLCLTQLAAAMYAQGDVAQAQALAEEGVVVSRQVGDERSLSLGLFVLAGLACERGDLGQARAQAAEGLMKSRTRDDPLWMAYGLLALAGIPARQGNLERAARLVGASDGLLERADARLPAFVRHIAAGLVAPARSALSTDDWVTAYAAGRALSLDEAIAEALGEEMVEATAATAATAARQAVD